MFRVLIAPYVFHYPYLQNAVVNFNRAYSVQEKLIDLTIFMQIGFKDLKDIILGAP